MKSANTVGTLLAQVDGGDAPPSGGRKPGAAGSAGKVFLVSTRTFILDCHVSSWYLISLSPPSFPVY